METKRKIKDTSAFFHASRGFDPTEEGGAEDGVIQSGMEEMDEEEILRRMGFSSSGEEDDDDNDSHTLGGSPATGGRVRKRLPPLRRPSIESAHSGVQSAGEHFFLYSHLRVVCSIWVE